jgi:hypothetical protein
MNALNRAFVGVDPDRRIIRRTDGTSLLVFRFTNRTDEDQQRWMDAGTDELNSMAEPFALIMDMRDLTKMSVRQRTHYAASRGRLRSTYETYKVLTVYVVRERLTRGFMTAVGWIQQPLPTSGRKFCETIEEAQQLCLEALEGRFRPV